MIDTDKYEGHTPGPWMWYRDDGDVDLVVANDQCHTVLEEVKALYSEGNENLIADAPLLLEEIKRLRRAFRIATAHIGFGNHLGHAELRRALNSMGIDYNSLPWADREWEEPLPTFGGVAHYD